MEGIPKPHGGRLVDRVVERTVNDLLSININKDLANDIENIADGVFSPLEGFMNEEDFMHVLKEGRLSNGVAWTIPIVLDLDEEEARRAKDAKDLLLKYEDAMAIMHVEDVFRFDKREMAQAVYQTIDNNHPGVAKTMAMNDMLVAGKIGLVNRPKDQLKMHRLTPKQTRIEFEKRGWNTVVGFQTRNIPHLAHEMLQSIDRQEEEWRFQG